MRDAARVSRAYGERSFVGSLIQLFRSTAFFAFTQKTTLYFRRFRLVRAVFTAVSLAVTLLGTGLAALIATAVFLVALPIIALIGFGLYLAAQLRLRRAIRNMSREFRDKTIYVFVSPRNSEGEITGGIFRELALRDENSASVIVTPHWFSKKGFGGKGAFLTVRDEGENLWLVRPYSFFSLRSRVLSRVTAKTVYFF